MTKLGENKRKCTCIAKQVRKQIKTSQRVKTRHLNKIHEMKLSDVIFSDVINRKGNNIWNQRVQTQIEWNETQKTEKVKEWDKKLKLKVENLKP